MEKPDAWIYIEGLLSAISIEQEVDLPQPAFDRGTVTENLRDLRLLDARVGEPRRADHDRPLPPRPSPDGGPGLDRPRTPACCRRPMVREREGEYQQLFEQCRRAVSSGCVSMARSTSST